MTGEFGITNPREMDDRRNFGAPWNNLFSTSYSAVRALESNQPVRALYRRFAFPTENTDFRMCVRRKVLKKIRSKQSVSECEVWFELSRPLHLGRPTKQSSWNSSWSNGRDVAPLGLTINKDFSDNELFTMSRYASRIFRNSRVSCYVLSAARRSKVRDFCIAFLLNPLSDCFFTFIFLGKWKEKF